MTIITPRVELALPSIAALGPSAWYRADDITVADGAAVSSWPDASGNGLDLDSVSGSPVPTFVAASGSTRPAVQFNDGGFLQRLSVDPTSLFGSGGVGTVYSVFFVDAGASGADMIWRHFNRYTYAADTFVAAVFFDGTTDGAFKGYPGYGSLNLVCWYYPGVGLGYVGSNDQDDAALASVATGTQSLSTTYLTVGSDGFSHLKGYIREIIFFKEAHTEEQRRVVSQYLRARHTDLVDTTTEPSETPWVDVSEDVVSGVRADWGIHGGTPKDRVAGPGTMAFDLDNGPNNAGAVRGYYVPGHASVRLGFALGTPARLVLNHALYGDKVKWVGTVDAVRPVPGVRDPKVTVSCVDWMDEAQRSKLRGLAVQTSIQSDDLFALIVAAVERQPPGGVVVGSGSDIYPYALDNTQDESGKVIGELQKLAMSEFGYIYVDAGVLTFEGRRRRGGAGGVRFAMSDQDVITAMSLTHERDDVLNRIHVSVHPRRVDSAATSVLFTLGSPVQISRGTSLTINCPYRDPSQQAQRVGGVEMVAPVASTDYTFNANEDGLGADLTSQLAIVVGPSMGGTAGSPVFGGNSAEVRVTNNGPFDGYIPASGLRLRGKGIYDFEPVISDQKDQDSIDAYGENAYGIDMPYQSSPANALDTGQFVLGLQKDPGTRVTSVSFLANWDDDAAEKAFNLAISDRVTVTASSVGLETAAFFVNGVRMDVRMHGVVIVTLDLTPADTGQYWLLDVAGRTELDETTVLGYGLFVAGWVLDTSELGTGTFLN